MLVDVDTENFPSQSAYVHLCFDLQVALGNARPSRDEIQNHSVRLDELVEHHLSFSVQNSDASQAHAGGGVDHLTIECCDLEGRLTALTKQSRRIDECHSRMQLLGCRLDEDMGCLRTASASKSYLTARPSPHFLDWRQISLESNFLT